MPEFEEELDGPGREGLCEQHLHRGRFDPAAVHEDRRKEKVSVTAGA
ncbi:hypothetical protein P1P75_04590 [Streptomyces sp. ID05-39B]|nr:hypothetical protein [Streptomyces sp. ID05-39B]MDX3525730.1 hypothetical protein [Streptomyces sp. ID05-39B]